MNKIYNILKRYAFILIVSTISTLGALILLIAGVAHGNKELIRYAGYWWASGIVITGIIASVLGIPAEIIKNGFRGSVSRYFKWIFSSFIATGLLTSYIASLIPDTALNIATVLLLIAAVVVFRKLLFNKPVIGLFLFTRIVLIFLPVGLKAFITEETENVYFKIFTPDRITITYDAIKNGEINFFRQDGKPLVWYCKKEDGSYEFFNSQGRHPVNGKTLEAVTLDNFTEMENYLKKEEQKKLEQEKLEKLERERQEQIRLEIIRQEKLKEEQLDKEEALRNDLIKPGVYIVEKKLGKLANGIKVFFQKIEILQDRSIKIYLLFKAKPSLQVSIDPKAENYACDLLFDNHGNTYKKYHYNFGVPTYEGIWLTLDFEPLKRYVTSLTFRSVMVVTLNDGFRKEGKKLEYTVTSGHRLKSM